MSFVVPWVISMLFVAVVYRMLGWLNTPLDYVIVVVASALGVLLSMSIVASLTT